MRFAVWPVPRSLDGHRCIDSRRTALQPERPFGLKASKIHDRPAAVFHWIVKPVGEVLRDTDLLRAAMTVLHDNFLHSSDLTRFYCVKKIVAGFHPGIPVVDPQLDAGMARQAVHPDSVCSVRSNSL